MARSPRLRAAVLLLLAPLLLPGCSVRKAAVNQLANALAAGGDTYASDDDPELVAAAVPFGLKTMESLLAEAPDCAARTLDISGDGRSNTGPDPASVYARGDWDGITVNGLPIGGHESDIAAYYARVVIRGPGAFVEVARTHRDFPPAFRRKLLRELTEAVFGALDP